MRIDPAAPCGRAIARAVDVLKREGVLVFPTSGLYGLGADALSPGAVARVFAIKRRPAHMPVLVLIGDDAELERVVARVPPFARPLLGLWPGGITLIFEAAAGVPAGLTGGTGKIGVRRPAHPVARALVAAFGGPITATSANLAGCPPVACIEDLDARIGQAVELVMDAGPLAGGVGSTILDASCRPLRLIREGAVPRQAIAAVLGEAPLGDPGRPGKCD